MLWSLILIPVGIGLYILLQRRRRRVAANFSRLSFDRGGVRNGPGFRRHIPPLLFLAGLSLLMVALARPQTVVSLPRVEGTVILAFDVSGSMAADDIKPTRMEAAKTAAKLFIQRQPPNVQIGVVGFSDSGFAIQEPTNNRDEVLATLARLTPQRGTSLAHGIQAALNTIATAGEKGPFLYSNRTPAPTPSPTPVPKGTYTSAAVILLSDGENNEDPDPIAAAQSAADLGVRIYTVGVGSPEGTTLHVNGFTVHTQLDEATLQQIAQMTGAVYFNAQNAQDLIQIYNNLDPKLIIKPEKMEVTSLLAGASIVLLLVGGAFSLIWFSRIP
jgi:Ca-activated chloride channel homolog